MLNGSMTVNVMIIYLLDVDSTWGILQQPNLIITHLVIAQIGYNMDMLWLPFFLPCYFAKEL